ncbi:MAG: hypothetical protein KJO32_17740 [Deltaproteobacteria bacterium]|nr:hypothetical protein [Deltaproteobacteria bacterium]
MATQSPSREEIAKKEIGITRITRAHSKMLILGFVLGLFTVPLVQSFYDTHLQQNSAGKRFTKTFTVLTQEDYLNKSPLSQIFNRNTQFLKELSEFETKLEESSFLRKLLLQTVQEFMLLFLGQGNEKAYLGQDNWLFYVQDLQYQYSQGFLDSAQLKRRSTSNEVWEAPIQPDPHIAIIHFQQELAKRNIELLLLPIPVKGVIYPDRIVAHKTFSSPVHNRSWNEFMSRLEQAQVDVFSADNVLYTYEKEHLTPAYLRSDTHWTADATRYVAHKLATYLFEKYDLAPGTAFFNKTVVEVTNRGDIADMLHLGPTLLSHFTETVSIEKIEGHSQNQSQILFLGDSFSNIYSSAAMGWGEYGGFTEHLAYALKQELDVIVQNDSGAHATRLALSKDLLRGSDRLAGKKLVIWQFAVRELAFGDWKIIPLELRAPEPSAFYVATSGETIKVSGEIREISDSPNPQEVPYKDNIVTIHLADLEIKGEKHKNQDALVYSLGMRNKVLTDIAKKKRGERITLNLQDWFDREHEYSGIRRSPLNNDMVELEPPNWGELVDDEK